MNAVALQGSEVRMLENHTTGDKLHVIAARGMVFSCWRPSIEEKHMLAADKPVWVVIRGVHVPEFLLTVGDRNQVVPPEIIKIARKNGQVVDSPEYAKAMTRHRWREYAIEALAWVFAAALVVAAVAVAWSVWCTIGRAVIGWVMADPLH